jgi:hypothetical protein
MAHFAQLDENNNVINILVVSTEDILDENGDESEAKGIEFLKNIVDSNAIWKQTSYTGEFRKKYAAIGGSYDPVNDCFINPKPYPSWIFNDLTQTWIPPVEVPNADDSMYVWDESNRNWKIVPNTVNNLPNYEVE